MEIQRIDHDITVLRNQMPAPGIGVVPINSYVLHAAEPVVIDTGLPDRGFLDVLGSVVDPIDVRWIWLTHPDRNHTGGLFDLLEAAPRARLVSEVPRHNRAAAPHGSAIILSTHLPPPAVACRSSSRCLQRHPWASPSSGRTSRRWRQCLPGSNPGQIPMDELNGSRAAQLREVGAPLSWTSERADMLLVCEQVRRQRLTSASLSERQ
jgi:hypothetical protein